MSKIDLLNAYSGCMWIYSACVESKRWVKGPRVSNCCVNIGFFYQQLEMVKQSLHTAHKPCLFGERCSCWNKGRLFPNYFQTVAIWKKESTSHTFHCSEISTQKHRVIFNHSAWFAKGGHWTTFSLLLCWKNCLDYHHLVQSDCLKKILFAPKKLLLLLS